MSLKQKFADEAYRARINLKLTQDQVAERAKITTRSVQYIEKGAWLPKQETMLRLMIVLRLNADLFCEEVGVFVPIYSDPKETIRA